MAKAGNVPISDRKFDKDDKGRWVVLFGMYEGEPLSGLPCPYVSWMLRRCKFVKGPFRRAARELLRRREQDPCERCECGPDYGQCPAYDPRDEGSPQWDADEADLGPDDLTDDDVRESVGLGPSDEAIENAEWYHEEGFGDR